MAASDKQYWLYLWRHKIVMPDDSIITRTCFGITSNLDGRRNGYEGHVGHDVVFERTWTGPFRPIKDLEDHIKAEFHDHLFVGHNNFRYEWIKEDIPFDQVAGWVDWEVEDHPSITEYQNGSKTRPLEAV